MPRKSAAIPRATRPSKTARLDETPRMISEEEKHQLIRMHAAARAPQDALQRMALWSGVVLSVLVLGFGWWFTVGEQVRQVAQQESDVRRAAAELDAFTELVESSPFLNPTASPTSNASASSFDDRMVEHLEGATRTRGLLSPGNTVASSSEEGTESVTPPGLTPE